MLTSGGTENMAEFEHLSFWSPEANEAADSRPFSVFAGPLYSPIQCEYGSFFDACLEDGEPPPPATEKEDGGRTRENAEEEEEMEEGERGGVLDQEGINGGCKNLLSERNRRRRLNQQLLALRSLVPCISKMDKRSILMDAATYLQNLHEEIDRLKSELSAQEPSSETTSPTSSESTLLVQSPEGEEGLPAPGQGQEASSNIHQHQIFELDAEELDDRTLSLKVAFKKGRGAFCQVQRMIESLGVSTTQSWTHETEGQKMLSTCFIHLKRNSTLTSEMLKLQATRAAVSFGFEIDFGD